MKSQYTPRDLKHAIYEAEVLQGASVRSIASGYTIPPSTPRDRLNGRTDAISAQLPRRILSIDQERWLADWIGQSRNMAFDGLQAMQLYAKLANCIAHVNGDNVPVGKNWINGFKARNPTSTTLIGHSLDKHALMSQICRLLRGSLPC